MSVAANGTQQNGESLLGTSISADGQYVVFTSNDANLVVGDTNNTWDVFVAPNPLLPLVTYANVPTVLSSISALDPDAGTEPLSISLSVNRGSLALLNAEGITFTDIDGRDGILTFSGALANLNAALDAGILYMPAIDYVGNDTLKIAINDQSFGAGLTDDATVALAVISASSTEPAVIVGTSGNDILIGGSSNNTLIGEIGDDVLIGGIGNDIYLYNLGDGSDIVLDLDQSPGNVDTLSFGSGIAPDSLSADASGLNLLIHVGNETLAIQNWFLGSDYQIERIEFEGGANYDGSWLVSLGSHAPELGIPIPDQSVDEDAAFSVELSMGTFTDQDIVNGDVLSYSAMLSDGSALPAWFSLDSSTDALSGFADNAAVGSYDIIITATDSDGQSISDTFTLIVNNINDAPIVVQAISDQAVDEDALFVFTLPADAFTDDDAIHGDSLTLSAVLADGSILPGWLAFDASTGTLTGTPDNGQVGTYDIRVTATDLAGTSASDVFTLTVHNVNDNPVLANALNDLTTDEDAPFGFVVPAGTFFDDDLIHGDRLTLSASLADGSIFPDWLTFDVSTGTFSGTPDNWDVGNYEVRVTATDLAGTSASDVFTLTVHNVNDNPVLANALGDMATDEDAPFSFTVPTDTFFDDDFIHGDRLTLSATLMDDSILPAWLNFDAATGSFPGTPDNWQVGSYAIQVTATDTAGTSVSDVFALTVNNTNDAPVLANPIPDRMATEGVAFGYMLAGDTFSDDDAIHGDTLTYTANLTDGSALPSWLAFDAATQTFTGTASADSTLVGTDGDDVLVDSDTGLSGAWDITVTATDTSGVSADDTFTLTLQGVSGNDTLQGGKGNDVLNGGGGNDIYIYSLGDGLDTLTDREGQDTVSFGTGINFDNTVIRTEGGITRLRFLDDCGCETEEGMDIALNADGSSPIETFAFADGTAHTLADLVIQQMTWYGDKKANTLVTGRHDDTIYAGKGGDTVYSGTGNDTLYGEKGNDKLYGEGGNDALYGGKGDDLLNGGCGDDTLDGGKGHNTLIGGQGHDTLILGEDGENTILFDLGDGWDTLKTAAKDEGHDNEIRFGEGIAPDRLWFERAANDLRISVLGTNDGMTIEGWYANKHRPIEEIKTANGYELEDKQIELLIQAMASFTPPPGSGGVLPTEMPQELQATLAAAWESER